MNSIFIRVLVCATLSWFSCISAADTEAEASEDTSDLGVLPLEDLRLFTRAFDFIRNSYVKELDDSELLEYAIRGMISELDPHSAYLDTSSFESVKINTTGEFGGLGIEVGMEDGFVKVISPIDDTPASKAGIEAGDLIIKLGDKSVKGLDLGEAVDIMRGPKGTTIVLTIVRDGIDQPFEVEIKRDIIKVNSVRADIKDEDFGYIRIAQFQVRTGQDVLKKYNDLMKENPDLKGLILDLRNNPGGVLQASVEVVDHFQDGGLVVYTQGRKSDSRQEFRASAGDIADGLPIVVLINGGSASASEIVAGALQDSGRALIVGTRTFGKGSVQTISPITHDKAIKLTTALYYTPAGRSIQAQGIDPDIEIQRVKVTSLQSERISEADLSGHLDNANGGEEKTSRDGDAGQTDKQNDDSQLFEAIRLLKGIHFFNSQKAARETAES